ncbi:uncharacterized protein LOC142333093 [Lycorma delicatula]|uniref:uncharacterized protein LOC142333093 n=1 Tax=Lycorma delicatula TaxID=130591 RepID=UPI003F517584
MEVGGKEDFKERTLRTLKQGLGKFWKRRSVTITEYDPCYKVAYLGNVITGWAKGEGCVEKPLNTLWKNYNSSSKPDVQMKLTVTQSGLKAVTKEHGLTEYWSHRVTYCAAPSDYPRVFCWVYRHEGRKLKQELRCHAVLCRKESTATRMATQLSSRLQQALTEFKRDKLSRQNARLSLANAVYDNPSLPRRKILLSTGSHNYRPPLERSKSAPKLMSIEESIEEDEEYEIRKSFRRPRHHSTCDKPDITSPNKSEFYRKSIEPDHINGDNSSIKTDETIDTIIEEELQEEVIQNPFGLDYILEERTWKSDGMVSFDEDEFTTDNETEEECSRIGSISDDESQLELALRIVEGSRKVEDDPLPTGYREDDDDHHHNHHQTLTTTEDFDLNLQSHFHHHHQHHLHDCLHQEEDSEEVPEVIQNTNSLVRNRKKLFEDLQKERNNQINFDDKPLKNTTLIQHRRRIFEPYHVLHFSETNNLDKAYLELEEDSTPSLQSISSSSDTSSKADTTIRAKPHYDLDSLSEEDSDESGYVEAIPQEGADDKERDLPHHHLMKTCVLTTKTACVHV